MKHKYIIDLEQDKESKTITIKITGLLMGENLFKTFSESFESFLKIFFEQTKKIK